MWQWLDSRSIPLDNKCKHLANCWFRCPQLTHYLVINQYSNIGYRLECHVKGAPTISLAGIQQPNRHLCPGFVGITSENKSHSEPPHDASNWPHQVPLHLQYITELIALINENSRIDRGQSTQSAPGSVSHNWIQIY
jgi:hypothetical protein